MAKRDPEGVKDAGTELRLMASTHFYRILHYHGPNIDLINGRVEALKTLASLETVFPGLQDELVSHTLEKLG